jgi:hypothetical protein
MADSLEQLPRSRDEIRQWLEQLLDPNQEDFLSDRVQRYSPDDLFCALLPFVEGDEDLWDYAVLVLLEADRIRAFPYLEPYLRSPDLVKRGNLVELLTMFVIPSAFDSLVTIVRNDPDASIRSDAATALGSMATSVHCPHWGMSPKTITNLIFRASR